MDLVRLTSDLIRLLDLQARPIAISFCATPPPGVGRVEHAAPASCAYWRLAGEDKVFYTVAEDHHACPVGAHTHAVPVPAAVRGELDKLIDTMVGLEYLSKEEIPSIPTRLGYTATRPSRAQGSHPR